MSKPITSQPVVVVGTESENKSSSTIASTVVPYYGSREPKQSVIETDRVIFQMMDDIQITVQPEIKKEEETSFKESNKLVPVSSTRKTSALWKFRIVFSSIIILLLVVATVVISELTKKEGS